MTRRIEPARHGGADCTEPQLSTSASIAAVQPAERHRIDELGCRCQFCTYALKSQALEGFEAVASSRKRLAVPTDKEIDGVSSNLPVSGEGLLR